MSEEARIVEMALVNPGTTAPNGDFAFEMQPRWNPARTVKFALRAAEAEQLHKALGAYLKLQAKASKTAE